MDATWLQTPNQRLPYKLVDYIVLGCRVPGESIDTNIVELSEKVFEKDFEFPTKFEMGPQHPLEGLSEVKKSNLGCGGPWESTDTHIVRFCEEA